MGKSSDDTSQQPVGSEKLTTVPALLRALGANDAPVAQQKAALREWLVSNTAGQSLRFSLRRNGYGLLLDETDEAKGIQRRKRL